MAASRETARRNARTAQVAAVALLAVAGVAAFARMGALTDVEPPPPPPAPADPAAAAGDTDAPAPVELDTMKLTSILWEKGNPPVEEPEAEIPPVAQNPGDPKGPKQPEPQTDPTARSTWRYIGQIVGPRSTHALLERDSLQRLVAAGGEVEGTRVTEVHKDFVMLDDGTGPKKVALVKAANPWESVGSRTPAPQSPYTNGQLTRPPGVAGGRPGQPVRPPAVPQARPIERPDEMDEKQMKLEELRRQQEEAGETGAMALPDEGDTARRIASAAGVRGGRR